MWSSFPSSFSLPFPPPSSCIFLISSSFSFSFLLYQLSEHNAHRKGDGKVSRLILNSFIFHHGSCSPTSRSQSSYMQLTLRYPFPLPLYFHPFSCHSYYQLPSLSPPPSPGTFLTTPLVIFRTTYTRRDDCSCYGVFKTQWHEKVVKVIEMERVLVFQGNRILHSYIVSSLFR